jgi:predicted metal-dependent enzyme (double-stranded beta helix superfamily)
MFNLDRFIENCRGALLEGESTKAIREVMAQEMSDPAGVISELGTPQRGGLTTLHNSPDLTIINVVWAPYMTIMPHNHNMCAVIGIYGGREDNIFWRRIKDDPVGTIEVAGARSLATGSATQLGHNIIHSVTNPTSKLTGSLHVYGGDFFIAERSEWETENLTESPYEVEHSQRLFEDANIRADAIPYS